MVTAGTLMAKSKPQPENRTCEYASVKIDDQILPLARAAAALSGDISTQEFISDAVNEVASRILGRQPINRRPPAEKPHGKGRAKKE